MASSGSQKFENADSVPAARAGLELLLDLGFDAVFLRDQHGRITSWNQGAVEMYGYRHEEALGRSPHELLQTEFPYPVEQIYEEIRRGGRWSGELIHTCKDGSKVVVSSRWALKRDDGGAVEAILEVNRDITTENIAQRELELANQKLNATLDSITDGLVVFDHEWRYTYVSDTATKIIGKSREELLGRVLWEVFPHAIGSKFHQYFHLAVESGQPQHFEEYYPEPLGQWIECHSYPSSEGLTLYFRDVTLQKTAQQALAFAERTASFGAWDWLVDSDTITWTEGSYVLYEFPPGERVRYEMWRRRIHPEDLPNVERAMTEALKGIAGYDVEYRLVLPSGTTRWINSRGEVLERRDGKAVRMSGINYDITERKLAEEELRRAQERFRKVYEHATTGIAVADLAGKFIQCNPAYEKLLGYSEAELKQMSFGDLVHPDDREMNLRFTRRMVAGEVPYFTVENRYVGRDGQPVWVQKHVSSMPDASGKPAFVIALVTDITERKRSEEQLRLREAEAHARAAELAAVLDAVPSIIFIAHDPECRRITCSREGYEVLRLPDDSNASLSAPDEERPSTFRVLRDGREQQPEELPMQIAAAEGLEVRNFEEQIVFEDGTSRELLGNAVPLFDESGRPRGAVGAFADITERKRAEEKQRESEEKLRLFIEHAPAAIAMFDRDMCYLAVSRFWMQDYGLTGEVIGRSHYDLFPGLPERWKEVHRRALSGEVLKADEDEFVRADGSTQYIKWQTRPWFAADGSIGGILIAAEDVTERVASQHRLRDSEDKFRTLANSIPQLCWMANADGWIFWYNDLWYQYTGTTPEAMQGWGWQSVHDPEVLPSVMERWKTAIDKGEPFEMVFPLRGGDGQFRPFLTRIRPVKDDQGRVIRWFGTNTDITEQKRIQEELRRSEALYRATFDNAAVGIAHLGLDGRWLRFNDAICTITGYSRDELLTKTFADITHPDDIGADWGQARRLLAGEISHYDMDKRYLRKDGSVVWVHLTGSVLRDENGKPQRFIAVVEDITRRKLAERALVQSEKLASAGRLASTIAHEINNPLEVLVNLLYLISSDEELPKHLQEHVRTAEGELNRLSQMARRTLSFYRPHSTPAPFAVNDVVEDVLRLFSPTLQSREIKVSQRLERNSEVYGTAAEIRQICINLISNALDAGTDSLAVRVSRRTDWRKGTQRAVRITVADKGSGISRETLKHVFEPFFTTKSQTGTGLGLWVCHEIVRNAGGSIRVRSKVGKGTVFSIYLPAGKAMADATVSRT